MLINTHLLINTSSNKTLLLENNQLQGGNSDSAALSHRNAAHDLHTVFISER